MTRQTKGTIALLVIVVLSTLIIAVTIVMASAMISDMVRENVFAEIFSPLPDVIFNN